MEVWFIYTDHMYMYMYMSEYLNVCIYLLYVWIFWLLRIFALQVYMEGSTQTFAIKTIVANGDSEFNERLTAFQTESQVCTHIDRWNIPPKSMSQDWKVKPSIRSL